MDVLLTCEWPKGVLTGGLRGCRHMRGQTGFVAEGRPSRRACPCGGAAEGCTQPSRMSMCLAPLPHACTPCALQACQRPCSPPACPPPLAARRTSPRSWRSSPSRATTLPRAMTASLRACRMQTRTWGQGPGPRASSGWPPRAAPVSAYASAATSSGASGYALHQAGPRGQRQ